MVSSKTKSDYVLDVLIYLLLAVLFFITLYPFWYVFIVSINDAVDTIKGGLTFLPRKINISSYFIILTDAEFKQATFITVLRTIIGTPVTMLCTSMLSFVFTKRYLVGYKFFRKAFIFTMYFGGGIIPFYMVLKSLGMIDNFLVYILPGAVGVYYMVLMTGFMDELPKEIEESAQIDGANDLVVFARIIMPLSKPILVTIALFVAIGHWNSFFDSYLYTTSQNLKTLQAVMMKILNQYETGTLMDAANSAAASAQKKSVTPDSIRMAATIVSTLPIIMVYPFLQKYFVKGMMIGAVKA